PNAGSGPSGPDFALGGCMAARRRKPALGKPVPIADGVAQVDRPVAFDAAGIACPHGSPSSSDPRASWHTAASAGLHLRLSPAHFGPQPLMLRAPALRHR